MPLLWWFFVETGQRFMEMWPLFKNIYFERGKQMTAVTMDNLKWCDIQHFKPSEFKEPNKMDFYLIHRLDEFRELCGKPVIIHSDYREGDIGTHGKGEAVDIHVKDMNLLDAYLLAEKTNLFKGIGVYPNWNNPGLHLDFRIGENARWGCWTKTGDKQNIYVPLDSQFWKRYVKENMK